MCNCQPSTTTIIQPHDTRHDTLAEVLTVEQLTVAFKGADTAYHALKDRVSDLHPTLSLLSEVLLDLWAARGIKARANLKDKEINDAALPTTA